MTIKNKKDLQEARRNAKIYIHGEINNVIVETPEFLQRAYRRNPSRNHLKMRVHGKLASYEKPNTINYEEKP